MKRLTVESKQLSLTELYDKKLPLLLKLKKSLFIL
jgi:hypothetical protein